jgi:hypothetical protein
LWEEGQMLQIFSLQSTLQDMLESSGSFSSYIQSAALSQFWDVCN